VVSIDSERDFCRDKLTVRLLFKINGHLHEVRCEPDREEIARQMYSTVAQYVASEVFRKLSNIRRGLPEPRDGNGDAKHS
jgi:hypothetical protein